MAEKALRHVYETYIRTTPARLWKAITRFEISRRYYYGMGLQADLKPGAPITYADPKSGKAMIVGKVLEVVPRKKLVHTFQFAHFRKPDPPSRVTYLIGQRRGVAWLRLIHDRFPEENRTYRAVRGGWVPILSGLKSLLETGKPLWKG
jgi:uncharacterized protein YndB with AHSA1/START domain